VKTQDLTTGRLLRSGWLKVLPKCKNVLIH